MIGMHMNADERGVGTEEPSGQRSMRRLGSYPFVSAIVPAAGMSTRMGGQNKLLLPFRGRAMIQVAAEMLLSSDVGEVIVVLGYEANRIREMLKGRDIKLVENTEYREGMSTSIRTGLAAVSPDAAAFLICLADQPLLELGEVNRIVAAFGEARACGKSIVVPFFRGRSGNPVIFVAGYKDAMLEVVGDTGCRHIVSRNQDQVFALEMETDHVIRDVDTPEDYRMLTKLSLVGEP